MEGNIEKKIFSSSILGGKGEYLKPKGDEPSDDDIPPPEKTEEEIEKNEEILTKESWKEYEKEMKEISDLAKEKEIDFKEIRISPDHKQIGTSFSKPEAIFMPNGLLYYYREARKFLSKEEIHQGLRTEFLLLRRFFQEPKLNIYEELRKENRKRKEKYKKTETDDKKLLQKVIVLAEMDEKINNLDRDLDECSEKTLSDSEIKKHGDKYIILDILYKGPEHSDAVEIFNLKELQERKKISDEEYDKRFGNLFYPKYIEKIRKELPHLDKESRQKLAEAWFDSALERGKKYQEYKDKQNNYVRIYQ